MGLEDLDQRTGIRFRIPGATLNYSLKKFFSLLSRKCEEDCPLLDISRGGLLFATQRQLKINKKLRLKMSLPEEHDSLLLKGHVSWVYPQTENGLRYEIGVRFSPYGEKKWQNPPGALIKIISLEKKFLSKQEPTA